MFAVFHIINPSLPSANGRGYGIPPIFLKGYLISPWGALASIGRDYFQVACTHVAPRRFDFSTFAKKAPACLGISRDIGYK